MYNVTLIESGYDFITLYFKTHAEMSEVAEILYPHMKKIAFKHYNLQRKNLIHRPGDVPHFHNGVDATEGPHFHIIYPHRPTIDDFEELKSMLSRKKVNIGSITPKEIS